MGKILRISLKLNFTPNTLGCYGLIFGCYSTFARGTVYPLTVFRWKPIEQTTPEFQARPFERKLGRHLVLQTDLPKGE